MRTGRGIRMRQPEIIVAGLGAWSRHDGGKAAGQKVVARTG